MSDAATSARTAMAPSSSSAIVCSMDNREACATAEEPPKAGAATIDAANLDGSPDGMDELLAGLLREGTNEASLRLLLSRVDVVAEISARGYEPLLAKERLAGRIGTLIVGVLDTIEVRPTSHV